MRTHLLLTLCGLLVMGCGGSPGEAPGSGEQPPAVEAPGQAPEGEQEVSPPESRGPGEETPTEETPTEEAPGWKLIRHEDFESRQLPTPDWSKDPVPDDGPYSDEGSFFLQRGVKAPAAWRISAPFGEQGWLTFESYTRNRDTGFSRMASVVPDPARPGNHVLRLASPAHTDATVVRPSEPLPDRYRISLRVGFADFGDGRPGLNGYDGGDETAEPWSREKATEQNGFYWLTILDALPRPHNNTWIHHRRKVVIDSDNHYPPWMEIFDGSRFVESGEHPVMMFALDGRQKSHELYGPPFLSWSADAWQPSGEIRAVDSYLPGEWYDVSIEREPGRYTLQVSGRFRYGGQQTYRATIDAAAHCIWHFRATPEEKAPGCGWPEAEWWPEYFMFGDPHVNYYEGQVLYDDVKLEVWR